MSDQESVEQILAKIRELESNLGYLQHDLESQNEMILVDEARIKKLEQTLSLINSKLDALIATSQSPRTLEDDKPPHY